VYEEKGGVLARFFGDDVYVVGGVRAAAYVSVVPALVSKEVGLW